MAPTRARLMLPLALVGAILAAACNRGPTPSHVSGAYAGKLPDDTLVEAATTVLVTTSDVVIAVNCLPLRDAVQSEDRARIDRAVAGGSAARLPAGVTIYTPPFSTDNPGASPLVVTDDKYAGRLCTPNSYRVLKD